MIRIIIVIIRMTMKIIIIITTTITTYKNINDYIPHERVGVGQTVTFLSALMEDVRVSVLRTEALELLNERS